jgi:hypothetical protein
MQQYIQILLSAPTRLAAQGRRKNRLKLCDSPEFFIALRHTDMSSSAALVPVRNFYQ